MATWTGAASRLPVAAGSVGAIRTWIVGVGEVPVEDGLDESPEPDCGAVATLPTDETVPGVVRWPGRVMVTWLPTATYDCWVASSWTATWRVVEVALSTC